MHELLTVLGNQSDVGQMRRELSAASEQILPSPQMPESVSKALDGLQSPLDAASKEALRFPVSVGERREDADHTGAPSYVVDAIFNSDVVRVQSCCCGAE